MSMSCAGHYYNRIHVTSVGCVMWGVCTAAFSVCRSLREGYLFWAVNGIGLALVIPTSQSLIADYYQVCTLCCIALSIPIKPKMVCVMCSGNVMVIALLSSKCSDQIAILSAPIICCHHLGCVIV